MRRYSTRYFIAESLKSMWKNGVMTSASILVLMSLLVVMGCFALLVFNVNSNMQKLGVLNEIVTFIDADKTEEEITGMYQIISEYSGVSKVVYCSKEQALEEEKAKLEEEGYSHLVESITEENNPYHASFTISYDDDASIEDLKYKLNNIEGIYKVNCRADIANVIKELRNAISLILVLFMAILFVVSIFVITNTIKLAVYSRKNEIMVMRYIGATKNFITIPFIISGALIGVLSSTISYFIQKGIYKYVFDKFSGMSLINIIPFSKISAILLFSCLFIGIFTGVCGSLISIRKYLKA